MSGSLHSDPAPAGVSQKAHELWEGTRTGLEQGTEVVKTGFQKASTSVREVGRLGREPAPGAGAPATNGSAAWENSTYDSPRR